MLFFNNQQLIILNNTYFNYKFLIKIVCTIKILTILITILDFMLWRKHSNEEYGQQERGIFMIAFIIVFGLFTLMALADIAEQVKDKIKEQRAKKEFLKNPSYYTYDEEEYEELLGH